MKNEKENPYLPISYLSLRTVSLPPMPKLNHNTRHTSVAFSRLQQTAEHPCMFRGQVDLLPKETKITDFTVCQKTGGKTHKA